MNSHHMDCDAIYNFDLTNDQYLRDNPEAAQNYAAITGAGFMITRGVIDESIVTYVSYRTKGNMHLVTVLCDNREATVFACACHHFQERAKLAFNLR